MGNRPNDPPTGRPDKSEDATHTAAATPDDAVATNAKDDSAAAMAAQDEADRPLGHRRGGGGAGFGPAIAGVMHGIDADIFRDPAAVQRMARDTKAVARTADGTVVGIELPGEGVIEEPDPKGKEPG